MYGPQSRSNDAGSSGDRRAQSEVIGVILILGLTITSTTLLVALGGSAFSESRDRVHIQNAEKWMTQLDSKASLVAHGSTETQRLETGQGPGSIEVDESAGTMDIKIDRPSGTIDPPPISLGTVRYEQDGTTIAYQGGGVWRKTGDGSVMVSPPEFDYEVRGGARPTLTLPLVTVDGAAGGGELVVTQDGETTPQFPSLSNPLENGEVTITITSEYHHAWKRFFQERTAGRVESHDETAQTVTIKLVVPYSLQAESAIASSAGSISVANNGMIDSYNSDEDPYAASASDEASVVIDGTFVPANGVEIKGYVRASGGADVDNNIVVQRDVIVDGSSDIKNNPTFEGRYSTGGDLTVHNEPTFGDDVIVGGDLTVNGKLNVDGDLYVGGDGTTVIPSQSTIDGDVIVSGPLVVEDKVTIGGDVEVSDGATTDGDVTFGGNEDYTADVTADGDVVIPDKTTVTGTVEASGEVRLLGSGEIDGNVRANGGGESVKLDSGSEITGDATAYEEVDDDGTVSGSIDERSSPITVSAPSTPVAALDANVEFPSGIDSVIDDRGSSFASGNDNGEVAAIDDSTDTLQNCGGTCTLPSGDYYLSSVDLGNSETLELDTTGGPVNVYVDGDFEHDGTVEITGEGRAMFYLNQDYSIDGGDVVNPDDRSSQLWLLIRSTEEASFSGNSVFKGVVYSPPDAGNGVEVDIENNVDIYGAIIGEASDTNNNYDIHYDSALEDYAAVSGSSSPQVTYLHISVTEVEVESG
jgi:cytoskeletal protein CcmA (bactofilin family)